MAYECQNFVKGQILTAECMNKIDTWLAHICGREITSGTINENGELVLTFCNGETMNIGTVIPEGALIVNVTITGITSETEYSGIADYNGVQIREAVESGRQVFVRTVFNNTTLYIPICLAESVNSAIFLAYFYANGIPNEYVVITISSTGNATAKISPIVPTASASTLGGVKPVAKTEAMTQSVGVDADGKLYTTGVTDDYINSLIDAKLGVIENGSY